MKDLYKLAQDFQEATEEPNESKNAWLNIADKLLPLMTAAALVHQTHHWNAFGVSSFGDHLLHERIYNDSQSMIDALAEKITGATGPGALQARKIIEEMHKLLPGAAEDQTIINYAIQVEQAILDELQITLSSMDDAGMLSPGLSNLLEGIYDKHEEFMYLLKQRIAGIE